MLKRLIIYLVKTIRFANQELGQNKKFLLWSAIALLGGTVSLIPFFLGLENQIGSLVMPVLILLLYLASLNFRVKLVVKLGEIIGLGDGSKKKLIEIKLFVYDVITALVLGFFSLLAALPIALNLFSSLDAVKNYITVGYYLFIFVAFILFAAFHLATWFFAQYDLVLSGGAILKSFKRARQVLKNRNVYGKSLLFIGLSIFSFGVISILGYPLNWLTTNIDYVIIAGQPVVFSALALMLLLSIVITFAYSFTYFLVTFLLLNFWAYSSKEN